MKKQIISLFILIFTAAGMAAETGYNGLKWFTNINKINLSYEKPIPEIPIEELKDQIRMQEKPMLGIQTQVYYIFNEDELTCISYSIDSSATSRLLDKLSKPIFITHIKPTEKESYIKKQSLSDKITAENENMLLCLSFIAIMGKFEIKGYASLKSDEGNGRIYIYDYNEDTRVWVLQDAIPGKTYVIYFPHEQDF